MNDVQVKYMVNRFLGWRLPQSFNPDGGVKFDREVNGKPRPEAWWPNGTNVFDADQAEAMVRYMLEGLPSDETRPVWMIELRTGAPCPPLYWYRPNGPLFGAGWTSIASEGMKFETHDQADAEVRGTVGYPDSFIIREHLFI